MDKEKDLEETELPLEEEATSEENDVQTGIDILKEEINDLNDRLLRQAADMDNMRKRYEKQIDEAKIYSVSNFAKDLLPVLDNLVRALEHKPSDMSTEVANIIAGVDMTRQEMINIFTKYKMNVISPSTGDKFDYNLHYAVSQVPNTEYPAGTILQLVQNGYMIGDRLLRPATVTVTKAQE